MLKRTDGARPPGARRKAKSATNLPFNSPDIAPPSLDLGELPSALGYALRRAQLAAFKNFKDTFKGFDITPAQYSVLIVIERNPGLKQNQISDALGIKRANFVLLLNTLEARGLAQRAPATDRRSYALQVTPSGKRLLNKLRSLSAGLEAKLSTQIGVEGRETLLRLLAAVATPAGDSGK
jgi:DNA-binding MarR family transcriptional regulator